MSGFLSVRGMPSTRFDCSMSLSGLAWFMCMCINSSRVMFPVKGLAGTQAEGSPPAPGLSAGWQKPEFLSFSCTVFRNSQVKFCPRGALVPEYPVPGYPYPVYTVP
eukprot:788928-Rhodomonas_salina.1